MLKKRFCMTILVLSAFFLNIHMTTLLPDLLHVSSSPCCDPFSHPSQKHCYFRVPQVAPGLQAQGEMPGMCARGGRLWTGQLSKALRRDRGRRKGVDAGCMQRMCKKIPLVQMLGQSGARGTCKHKYATLHLCYLCGNCVVDSMITS